MHHKNRGCDYLPLRYLFCLRFIMLRFTGRLAVTCDKQRFTLMALCFSLKSSRKNHFQRLQKERKRGGARE